MALQTILLYPVYPTLSTQTKIILICPTLSKQTKIILPGVKRRVPNHDLDRNRRPEASWTTRPIPGLTFFFFLSFVFFFFVFSVVLSFVIITTLFKLAEEREKTFAKMDENGDGSIAFNEWLAFFLQVGQKIEPGIVCLIGWWIWGTWDWNWSEKLKMLLRKSSPRWRPCKFNTWSLTTAAVQRKLFDIKQKSNESFSTSDCWGRKHKQTLPSVHQFKFVSYV